ncbi:hypothetical protein AVEN_164848-1 [Araneus ventricosus]|uniref:Uncharacterized protein n=1 Tax=Araneus ventricosus TaxID=182803 RepID=A0A4Y2ITC1_ARAVE|nr:hypothetical protein AVEN_164848-1 [Araneus ventricosus]
MCDLIIKRILFRQCLYHFGVPNINPILHMLVEWLCPRWSSPGLKPFLREPGQCGFFAPHQQENVWPPTYELAWGRSAYTMDLQWNRVSSPESCGPKAESLPLGHRGLLLAG